jgi:hypothetical protein
VSLEWVYDDVWRILGSFEVFFYFFIWIYGW